MTDPAAAVCSRRGVCHDLTFNWYLRGDVDRTSNLLMLPQMMWPMLAATPAPMDHRIDGADKDSDFPGEQPSDKELSDWLEAVLCRACDSLLEPY